MANDNPEAGDVEVIDDEIGKGGEKENVVDSSKIVNDDKDKNSSAMETNGTVDKGNVSGNQEKTQQVQPYRTRYVARGNFKTPSFIKYLSYFLLIGICKIV